MPHPESGINAVRNAGAPCQEQQMCQPRGYQANQNTSTLPESLHFPLWYTTLVAHLHRTRILARRRPQSEGQTEASTGGEADDCSTVGTRAMRIAALWLGVLH